MERCIRDRSVTRGWADVLVSTLGFHKNGGLGWAKKVKDRQNPPKKIALRTIIIFAYPTLTPGDAPVVVCRAAEEDERPGPPGAQAQPHPLP